MLAAARTKTDGPVRTCAGCRAASSRGDLLRFAFADDPPRLSPDPKHELGGRGVSVHPTLACLRKAARGGFSRSLKRPMDVDPVALGRTAARLYERRVEGLLLAASRSRSLAIGTDAVRDALRAASSAHRPGLVLFAADAAGRREEITRTATDAGWPVATFGERASLGRLFGRSELAVAAIPEPGIASEVARALSRATALSLPEDA